MILVVDIVPLVKIIIIIINYFRQKTTVKKEGQKMIQHGSDFGTMHGCWMLHAGCPGAGHRACAQRAHKSIFGNNANAHTRMT